MQVRLIEVPMDFGASRRGVDIGPSALRLAGLADALKQTGHGVEEDREPLFIPIQEQVKEFDPRLKYLPEILKGCEGLAVRVENCLEDGRFPLIMGGDHSIAMGSIAGASAYWHKQGKKLGVVWIDAHGDCNTPETTPSGNIHGMPLAASMGFGDSRLTALHGNFRKVDPRHVVLLGIRDLDPGEKKLIKTENIRTFTITDIDRLGMYQVMEQCIAHLKDQVDAIHVSFDVDSLDPGFAPGVGTPVPSGLTPREVHCIMESLASSPLICSADIVEVNPMLDVRNQTAELGVKLMASLLGSRIL